MIYQQGDILLKRTGKVGSKARKLEGLVLAIGEATGHAHTITEEDSENAELYKEEGSIFLEVAGEKARIIHQEHKTLEIPKGTYKVERVVEYDHFAEEAREVID